MRGSLETAKGAGDFFVSGAGGEICGVALRFFRLCLELMQTVRLERARISEKQE
jgi:hypothetical protein